MKTLNKILAGFLVLGLVANTYAASSELNIESVNTDNKDTLIISLDTEVESSGEKVEGDISIFKDLEVLSADITSGKIVKVELAKALEKNTSYSIMSYEGVSGDMNFEIKDKIAGVTLENNSFDLDLEKITIIDKYNIEITYAKDIEVANVTIKLLKDIKIKSLSINLDTKKDITAELATSIDSLSDYILMAYAIEDETGQEYSFGNPIFEFTSANYSTEESEDDTEENVNEDVIKNIEETINEDIDPMMVGEIEEVALNSAETPDTGAETNILIIMTFIATSVVFIRRKFAK